MYTQETIEQCIKLRVEGKAYRTIAAELQVSLSSVTRWCLDHKDTIRKLSAARIEALHEECLGKHEDKLLDLANEIAAINAELKLRTFGDVSTEFLLYRKTCLQARLEKLAAREAVTLEAGPETTSGTQPGEPKMSTF
jgi:hypothetical protein